MGFQPFHEHHMTKGLTQASPPPLSLPLSLSLHATEAELGAITVQGSHYNPKPPALLSGEEEWSSTYLSDSTPQCGSKHYLHVVKTLNR